MAKLNLLKQLLLQPTAAPTPRTSSARAEWIGNFRGPDLVAAKPLALSLAAIDEKAFADKEEVYVWGLGSKALVWPLSALRDNPLLETQIGEQTLLLSKATLGGNPILLAPSGPSAFRSTLDVLFEDQIYMDLKSGSQWSLSLGACVYGPSAGARVRRGLGGLPMSWAMAKKSGLELWGLSTVSGSERAFEPPELLVLERGEDHPAWRISQLPETGLLLEQDLLLARIDSDAIAWQSLDHTQQRHKFNREGLLFAQDEATGSRWSLVSGRAIAGPLEGRQLVGLVHLRLKEIAWRSLFPGQILHEQAQ
jgi:hypothetical protein